MLLDENMNIKLSDFGLATIVKHDHDLKETHCGTPNYIAPEILEKTGYSYPVDVWSIGCSLYTMLIGRCPFETKSISLTYGKIRAGDYVIPKYVNEYARDLIEGMLTLDQYKRPILAGLADHPFLTAHRTSPVVCITPLDD